MDAGGLEALGGRVESLALRTIVEAAEALLGEHPERVCATLAAWGRLGQRPLAGLGEATVWALHPLGQDAAETATGTAPGTVPGTLAAFLDGQVTDAGEVRFALEWCRSRLPPVRPLPPLPQGESVAPELWRRSLLTATEGYGAETVRLCGRLHRVLMAGRPTDADAAVAAVRPRLIAIAEHIRELAAQVTGSPAPVRTPPSAPEPPAPEPPAPEPPAPEPPAPEPAPPEPAPPAPSVTEPPSHTDDWWSRPQTVERGNRTLVALLFVGGTLVVALLMLTAVLGGWLPD